VNTREVIKINIQEKNFKVNFQFCSKTCLFFRSIENSMFLLEKLTETEVLQISDKNVGNGTEKETSR